MTRGRALRGALAPLLPRARRAPRATLVGNWDAPTDEDMLVGRELTLTGWVVPPRPGSVPTVRIYIDGLPAIETTPDQARPDVAAALGAAAATGNVGWSARIATRPSDAGASVEVVVEDAHDRMSLGVRRLHGRTGPSALGQLDFPRHGDELPAGGAVHVAGWVHFNGEPADSVEIFLGDAPGIALRTAIPRPDVRGLFFEGNECPRALGVGFSDFVAVPAEWHGSRLDIVVRARSLGGEVWMAEPTTVTVGESIGPAEDFDEGTPLAVAELARLRPKPRTDAAATHPQRLCVFTHSLRLGGGELYLQELVLRLARDHGFEIMVVSPTEGQLKDELRAAGIAVHLTREYAIDPVHYLAGVGELAVLLTQWQADAVVVNTLGVFPAVDAAHSLGLPVFWAIHESFSIETFAYLNWGPNGLHPQVLDRWMNCLASSATVFESYATLAMYKDRVSELNGTVVHYGIESSKIAEYRDTHDRAALRVSLGFAADDFVLLCMGVIQERKAQLGLVLAFDEVARAHPHAKLVLVGDHPSEYAGSVRELIERLDLTDRVRVEPIQVDTYAWYLVADVLVSASDTESLPRSVLEAMTFGRPALAADVFGLSEVIRDGENGWLCRAHSRMSLIAGLKRVLSCSPEQFEAISRRCETEASAFDGANYAAEYATMIREAGQNRVEAADSRTTPCET